MPARRVFLLALLLARLLLGLAYSALNPLGEAPDETDHYAYAAFIGREGRLPAGPEMTQAKHPPLYHWLAAVAGRPGGLDFTFLRSNPDVSVSPGGLAPNFFVHTRAEDWPWRRGALSMHLGRLISVLAGVVLVAATYGIGRRIWPAHVHAALMGAAFVAFLPESLFIGASVSNDMLAAALSALTLMAAVSTRRWPAALLTGLLMGLAFLTKVSCVALWPVAILLLLLGTGPVRWGEADYRQTLFGRVAPAVVAALVALAIISPWLWRNWQLYQDPMGTPLVLATIDQRTGPLTVADLGWLAKGWFFSFWGKTGGAGHLLLPPAFYMLWAVILAGSASGWFVACRRRAPLARVTHLGGWLILLGAPLLVAITMLGYSSIALGTDQGRLLFPALAAIGLFIGGGVAALSRRSTKTVTLAWTAGLAAVAVLALVFGIIQPFAPPSPPSATELASSQPLQARFGDAVELVAARRPAEDELLLYWRAMQPVGTDLRVGLNAVDSDGNRLWEWQRSPGAGRYSTDRWWPAAGVVADPYRLPAGVLARAARLEVRLYDFATRADVASQSSQGGSTYALEVPAR